MSETVPLEEQRNGVGELPYCSGTTRKGTPCRNRVLPGQKYCRIHADRPFVQEPSVVQDEPEEINVRVASAAPHQPRVEDIEIRIGGAPRIADAFYPSSGSPADHVYELEVEVRNHVPKGGGPLVMLNEYAAGLLHLIGDNLLRMTPPQVREVMEMMRGAELKDYLDADFWKGIGMVLQYQVNEQVDFIKRRLRGEYEIDAYGMDRELLEVVRPFLSFMYSTWWRTSVEGLENVPAAGRGMLVANHSGILPWDGIMIATAVLEDHPSDAQRVVRNLYFDWLRKLPFITPTLASIGQVPDNSETVTQLLDGDELVCVFPEGSKGGAKLYKDRYRLARFGRGTFVQSALRSGAPLIPVSVTGSEEIYPMLANIEPLAKLLGVPFFPITPFFPWFGPLGAIPLPTRWTITFGQPFSTAEYGPEAANDSLIVFMLSEQIRSVIQETINAKLSGRKSMF